MESPRGHETASHIRVVPFRETLIKSAAPTLRDESQGGGEGHLGWLEGLKTPGPLEGGR